MFAKIEENEIIELREVPDGEGWIAVPEDIVDLVKAYDPETHSIVAMSDDEKSERFEATVLADAWSQLRSRREVQLYETDSLVAADREPIDNMVEYRSYLRDLPSTYNDKTILDQDAVMIFDEYVASL
tara:strand:+ start:1668 stop:2051 length:384 start_codon:yes stop_codon:yes gene_type:complete